MRLWENYGGGRRRSAAADGAVTTGLDITVRHSYHRGMKATISEKGQITIPKRLRDRLGLRPGTILDFEEAGGRLVGRKLVPADHLDDLVGILTLPTGGTDAFIRDIRGPGQRPQLDPHGVAITPAAGLGPESWRTSSSARTHSNRRIGC